MTRRQDIDIYDLEKVSEIIILFENTVCIMCPTTKINAVGYESLQPKLQLIPLDL